MFQGIDHIVIVVSELESAIASFTSAGFTVVRGGKHPIGTHNALIAFADECYLELIAFVKPVPGHPWQVALDKGGGIIDFCMRTDDSHDNGRFSPTCRRENRRSLSAHSRPPRWLSPELGARDPRSSLQWTAPLPDQGRHPARRTSSSRARAHRNGATGISTLAIAVDDPARTAATTRECSAAPAPPSIVPSWKRPGVSFTIGPSKIQLLASKSERGPLARWIHDRGQSPTKPSWQAMAAILRCSIPSSLKARASGSPDRVTVIEKEDRQRCLKK